MLKKLFKTGVTAAAGWVGNAIGGSVGKNIATSAVGSLFSKDGGSGGNFELASTAVPSQDYGGKVGFERSDSAGNVNKIKTADGKQLSEEWEYRLNKWYKNKDTRYT